MIIVALGDIHGRTNWKEIIEKNKGSHFIFTGDYVDPYEIEVISELSAINNFKEIIDFKITNPDMVTLLIGNHDSQYLFYPMFQSTSAISYKYKNEIIQLFKSNEDLFQFSYQINNYLFTHAGVTNGWLKTHRDIFNDFGLKSDYSNISDTINTIAKSKYNVCVFDNVSFYRFGSYDYGSLIWADIRELYDDYIIGLKQICGHNKVRDIVKAGDLDSCITFIDCLFEQTKELIIEIE